MSEKNPKLKNKIQDHPFNNLQKEFNPQNKKHQL